MVLRPRRRHGRPRHDRHRLGLPYDRHRDGGLAIRLPDARQRHCDDRQFVLGRTFWPSTGLWVIGLFVGIDLIFNGWAWIALSLALRKTPEAKSVAA
jgi:hypothetical protein